MDDLSAAFKSWISTQMELFFQRIQEDLKEYTKNQTEFLHNKLQIYDPLVYNSEVRFQWILTELNMKTEFVVDHAIQYVENIGRQRFVEPIFIGLYKYKKELTQATWKRLKNTYHPIVQDAIEEDFRKEDQKQAVLKFIE